MSITVRAAWAERYIGGKAKKLTLNASTAREAALAAGIPPDEIALIERDGALIALDELLKDGDVIEVYPPIIGG